MLVRLFIIVLTLVGPVPLRACTCAVTEIAHSEAMSHENDQLAAETSCSCKHRSTASAGSFVAPESCNFPRVVDLNSESHPIPDRHHENCPALNPRTVDSSVVTAPTVVCPADSGICDFVCVDSTTTFSRIFHFTHPRPVGNEIPLYLSLRSLRI